jgi:putative two-component system response regulator
LNLEEGLLRGAEVLVVDDEPANVALIETILERNGFTQVRSVTDPRQFRQVFVEQQPDIVLLDLHMPHVDGIALLAMIRELRREGEFLPALVLSADATPKARHDALGAGATDFLTKPLDTTEVGLRVLNYLEARRLHLRLAQQTDELDKLVKSRTQALERAQSETLQRLYLVSEFKDDETHEHTNRVGVSAGKLAARAGETPERVQLIESAAPLHDLGKVGVPDQVLLKPGKLTPEEFEIVREHPGIGARLIGETDSEILRMAKVIAESHHERWNGGGYPNGLRGNAIPIEGRIVTICDVFDALTHERPYKPAWTVDQATEELISQRGMFFDAELIDLFIEHVVPELPWLAGIDGGQEHRA